MFVICISDLKHIISELTCTRLWVAQSHLIRKTHVDLEFIYLFLPIRGSTNCTDSITFCNILFKYLL